MPCESLSPLSPSNPLPRQIVVNFQNKSVDGLALPFLASWFFGDFTNLIGCILTEQLPFQASSTLARTYLASYFCFIDICLVFQFCYYSDFISRLFRRRTPPKEEPESFTPLLGSRILSPQVRYRAIHHAASNVAAAAVNAAYEYESQFGEGGLSRRSASMSAMSRASRRTHGKSVTMPYDEASGRHQEIEEGYEDEEDDEVPAMFESFHSEDGRTRKSPRQKRPSLNLVMTSSPVATTNPSRLPLASETQAQPAESSSSRGRALTRQRNEAAQGYATTGRVPLPAPPPFDESEEVDPSTITRAYNRRAVSAMSPSGWGRSRERRSASRRSATLVFLGVWVLFGIGGWSTNGIARSQHFGRTGNDPSPVGRVIETHRSDRVASLVSTDYPSWSLGTDVDSQKSDPHDGSHRSPPPPKKPVRSNKLIIGRISAWSCTVLYLTSRLPQIWKNFVRKSVQGLSIALFVSAFLGNFFYVLSIMTDPQLNGSPTDVSAYIMEKIPYLLGSGGTLLFDVTIVTQSFIYRGRRPLPSRSRSVSAYGGSVHRRSLARRSTYGEDDRLLSASIADSTLPPSPAQSRKRYGSLPA
ncbi:hypothetical protein FRB99_006028 [Tulasnella sp. 403]|nr:hypothetical protein FRB99_006028 [Tulasnella sp. 403]